MRLIFDFPAGGRPCRREFADPVEVVTAATVDEVVPALEAVRAATADPSAGLVAAGYVAYEAAPAFEPRMRVRSGGRMPLVWFGLFDRDGAEAAAGPTNNSRGHNRRGVGGDDWTLDLSPARHAAAVAEIRAAIAEGRTYQANLTARLRGPAPADPFAVYEELRRAQGTGWHAFLDLGRFVIASASPELFFQRRGGTLTTRPMKGTRRRGRFTEEDRAREAELAASPKDRAENLMIVDLLRNDVGRVARPAGVRVPRLLDVERYRTVFQMTSTVTGELRDDVGLVDLFRALFPCGSVTGAPKISTMELIAGLETSPREVYCGAIGIVEPGGDCTFNVPIRTLWLDRDVGRATYGAGGGIVWDSDPAAEYDELQAKTRVLTERWPPFRLLETMRMDDGVVARRDRHLARLRRSADYFGFPFPAGELDAALADAARRHPTGSRRLRLTLEEAGVVELESTILESPLEPARSGATPDPPAPGGPVPIAVADAPVDSSDRFLFHKTTHRAVYDRLRKPDCFDTLLHNERGEVTEFTIGNVVVELDGRLVTPPVECGLLAGCMREELLEAGEVEEEVVRIEDLARTTRIWLVNSVRGWVPVAITAPAASS